MKLSRAVQLLLCVSSLACGSSEVPASLRIYAGIGSDGAAPGPSGGGLTAELSSASAAAVSAALTQTNQIWSGTLTGLSSTAVYRARVQSKGAAGATLGSSDLASFTLQGGAQGLFAAVIRSSSQVGLPVVFSSVFAGARTIGTQGHVTLQANLEAGTGPAVSLLWTASGGSFDDPTLGTTGWTAGGAGTAKLTVTATDANGSTAVVSFPIVVSDAGTATPPEPPVNFWPNIRHLTAPTQVAADNPAQYSVLAIDADGDPIVYAWSASCTGSFTTPDQPATQFRPAASGICMVTIKLDDGRGGINSQTANLTVQ